MGPPGATATRRVGNAGIKGCGRAGGREGEGDGTAGVRLPGAALRFGLVQSAEGWNDVAAPEQDGMGKTEREPALSPTSFVGASQSCLLQLPKNLLYNGGERFATLHERIPVAAH